jgi:hypothetical protein
MGGGSGEPPAGDRAVEEAGLAGVVAGDRQPHEEFLVEGAHPHVAFATGRAQPRLESRRQIDLAHPPTEKFGNLIEDRAQPGASPTHEFEFGGRFHRAQLADDHGQVGKFTAGQKLGKIVVLGDWQHVESEADRSRGTG